MAATHAAAPSRAPSSSVVAPSTNNGAGILLHSGNGNTNDNGNGNTNDNDNENNNSSNNARETPTAAPTDTTVTEVFGDEQDDEDIANDDSYRFESLKETCKVFLLNVFTWKKFREKSTERRTRLLQQAAQWSTNVHEEGNIRMFPLLLWFCSPVLEEIYQVRYRAEQSCVQIWIGLYCLIIFGVGYFFVLENIDEGASQEVIASAWAIRVVYTTAIVLTCYITHVMHDEETCLKRNLAIPRSYHWIRTCVASVFGYLIIWRSALEPDDKVYYRLVGIWSIGWQAVVFMYASLHFYEFCFFSIMFSAYYLTTHYFVRDMGPDNPEFWTLTVFVFFFFITMMSEYHDRNSFIESVKVYQQIDKYQKQRAKAEAEEKKAVTAVNDKRQFISYIFHEIRVPLSAVRMGIDGSLHILEELRSQAERINDTAIEEGSGKREAPLSVDTSLTAQTPWQTAARTDQNGVSSALNLYSMNTSGSLSSLRPLHSFPADMEQIVKQLAGRGGMFVTFEQLENLSETLNTMKNSMEQAMRILDDVLSINKVESGRFELYPDYFRLSTLIEEETAKHKHMAEHCNISLVTEMHGGHDIHRLVIGDYVRLCQVYDNFLSNALKFTGPSGQITAGVTILEKYKLGKDVLKKNIALGSRLAPRASKSRKDAYAVANNTNKSTAVKSVSEHVVTPLNDPVVDKTHFHSRMAWKINQLLLGRSVHDDNNESSDTIDPVEEFGADEGTMLEFYDVDEEGETGGASDNPFLVESPGRQERNRNDSLSLWVGTNEEETKQARNLRRVSRASSSSGDSFENEDASNPVKMGKEALYVRLWVQDTGEGITPEDCKLIFDAYKQTGEGTKKEHSTGLGLNIAQHITRLHGGKIGVHSDGLGHGSTFYMDLPLRVASKTASKQFDTPTSSFYGLKSQKVKDKSDEGLWNLSRANERFNMVQHRNKKTFSQLQPHQTTTTEKEAKYIALIVDDTPTNSSMLKLLLTQRDFKCEVVADGIPAVQYIKDCIQSRKPQPSVVFMDYSMPQMNGPDAVTEIRKLGYTGAILGITGNANQRDEKVFLDAGADSVLWKPVSAKMLEEGIQKAFNVRSKC